jgi:hypothetical protein
MSFAIRLRNTFLKTVKNQLAILKALQPHLARRVAVTRFCCDPIGNTQQSLGL